MLSTHSGIGCTAYLSEYRRFLKTSRCQEHETHGDWSSGGKRRERSWEDFHNALNEVGGIIRTPLIEAAVIGTDSMDGKNGE